MAYHNPYAQHTGYAPPTGPPPQGYGAPPPPQHGGYAPPAAPPYGSHPPPPQGQNYGAPLQSQYGAPPPGQYAPPPGQYAPPPHQAYGAPPPNQYAGGPPAGGFFYLGVPVPPPVPHQPAMPPPGYDANADAAALRKAMKGLGTDEKALIKVLAPLDAFQVDAVSRAFKMTVGKDLLKDIEKETSGWFEGALRAKVLGPLGYDVWLIHRACAGLGTNEKMLTDVLVGRSNADMHLLKTTYQATYGKPMEQVVDSELSMKTRRLFTMVLQGVRQEGPHVDPAAVSADVKTLANAFRGAGTDEVVACGVLVHRSDAHLAALASEFERTQRRKLSAAIKSEFSGHMEDALLHIAEGAEGDGRGVVRDAKLIEASMAGAGTKDEALLYRVTRASWDRPRFAAVKQAYQSLYRKDLVSRIKGETSGDFERMLVAVVGR